MFTFFRTLQREVKSSTIIVRFQTNSIIIVCGWSSLCSHKMPYANDLLNIPNCTFLVRFGGISGEFGRAMVRILARRSRAKIPMARPNEPDMPPKRTKKVRLGIYRTQIQPKI